MKYIRQIAFFSFLSAFLLPTALHAKSEASPLSYETDYTKVSNDESPFVGGVFSREVGDPIEPVVKQLPDRPRLIADDNGNTNQVVVLLDLEDSEVTQSITASPEIFPTRGEAESAVVEAVNARHPKAAQYFTEPDQAWHLIWEDRLDNEIRQQLYDAEASEDLLHQYIVLSYSSIDEARAAVAEMRLKRGVRYVNIDRAMKLSWAPNDPYFPIDSQSAGYYQWGMHAMRFPQAWDKTKGHGYVGVIDAGLPATIPADLQKNYREQFSFVSSSSPSGYEYHGTHVMGIVAASANNNIGVTGGCPSCSVAMIELNPSDSSIAASIHGSYQRGLQVINMSLGAAGGNCSNMPVTCSAISTANSKDVLMIAASGNGSYSTADFPANHSSVLAVGAAENTNPGSPSPLNWERWIYSGPYRSQPVGLSGVMAPGKSVVSTVPAAAEYISTAPFYCSDRLPADESGMHGDGFGSCTGTSMATPHISALGGILRSINPRLTSIEIQEIIRSSGSHALSRSTHSGYGLVQADLAVDDALAQTPSRLTPLFSLYSHNRRDYFFTTVPQMAAAATWGTLRPVNTPGYSAASYAPPANSGATSISGYSSFPGGYPSPYGGNIPLAAAWIFTTPKNPKSASVSLAPLYRLSWKCGDPSPYPPSLCSSVPNHMDTTYTADPNGVAAFQGWGYKLDGIEGYIYPKSLPQPSGTVRLMRKYNPSRDDHAIFPENITSYFTSMGYTENSGSDWLGYVYPNNNGNVPVIQ